MTIVIFILILSILVFVHEFGHFMVARRAGVRVEEFGFGFPPRLFGRRHGDTIYSINLIPFGGFVRLQGEQDDPHHRPDSFLSASFKNKFAIIAAGVIMNYLLAWLLLSAAYSLGVTVDGQQPPTDRLARVSDRRIESLVGAGSAAERAGLNNGDYIIDVNGQVFSTTEQLINYVKSGAYPVLTVRARRAKANNISTAIITPDKYGDQNPHYGFGLQSLATVQYPWGVSGWPGLKITGQITGQAVVGFGRVISNIVMTGRVGEDVAGPVGIAVLTGQVRQLGIVPVLQFMAVLSISLAVINFLPIPALDGGRAMFIVIEKIRGRPVNRKTEGYIHALGFYLLIILIILISIRDFRRFGVWQNVLNLFQS